MKHFALLAVLILAGCANAIRPQHVTADEISLQYDTLLNSRSAVVERAASHCAASGKTAELVSEWDNIGTRGATFRCV